MLENVEYSQTNDEVIKEGIKQVEFDGNGLKMVEQ